MEIHVSAAKWLIAIGGGSNESKDLKFTLICSGFFLN